MSSHLFKYLLINIVLIFYFVISIEENMRTANVCVENVGDRAKWRFLTKVADPK